MNNQPPLARPDGHMASGQRISFLLPSTAVANIDDVALALSNICRFGGHTRQFFSNAQYCVLLSQIVPPGYEWEGLLTQAYKAIIGDPLPNLTQYFAGYDAFEARIKAAIRVQHGLPQEPSDAVVAAHYQLKATEFSQLAAPRVPVPIDLEGIKPLSFAIPPMQANDAYNAFMDRYDQLMNEHELVRRSLLDREDSA